MSKRALASGKLGPWSEAAGPTWTPAKVAAIRMIEGELEAGRTTLSHVVGLAAKAMRETCIQQLTAAGHHKAAALLRALDEDV